MYVYHTQIAQLKTLIRNDDKVFVSGAINTEKPSSKSDTTIIYSQ